MNSAAANYPYTWIKNYVPGKSVTIKRISRFSVRRLQIAILSLIVSIALLLLYSNGLKDPLLLATMVVPGAIAFGTIIHIIVNHYFSQLLIDNERGMIMRTFYFLIPKYQVIPADELRMPKPPILAYTDKNSRNRSRTKYYVVLNKFDGKHWREIVRHIEPKNNVETATRQLNNLFNSISFA